MYYVYHNRRLSLIRLGDRKSFQHLPPNITLPGLDRPKNRAVRRDPDRRAAKRGSKERQAARRKGNETEHHLRLYVGEIERQRSRSPPRRTPPGRDEALPSSRAAPACPGPSQIATDRLVIMPGAAGCGDDYSERSSETPRKLRAAWGSAAGKPPCTPGSADEAGAAGAYWHP